MDYKRLLIIGSLLFALVACTPTRVSFIPADGAPARSANNGPITVISGTVERPEALGGVELGIVEAKGGASFSHQRCVRLWKREAARHGANAVRWSGESGSTDGIRVVERAATAKIYWFPDLNDPRIRAAQAKSYENYHD